VTKRAIASELGVRRAGLSSRQAETAVNALFEAMAQALSRGERIELRGFGIFAIKQRRARWGRNPKTGSAVTVAAKPVPFFRAGTEMRLELNGAAIGTERHPA
jgi:integration host factor subunit beta